MVISGSLKGAMYVCMYVFLLFACVGGYGFVFIAQDISSAKDYALKVLLLIFKSNIIQKTIIKK